jgi:hypothetical protein
MDEIWSDKLREKRRHDIGEEDDSFWDVTDEVLGCRQDDHIEDVVDKP